MKRPPFFTAASFFLFDEVVFGQSSWQMYASFTKSRLRISSIIVSSGILSRLTASIAFCSAGLSPTPIVQILILCWPQMVPTIPMTPGLSSL